MKVRTHFSKLFLQKYLSWFLLMPFLDSYLTSISLRVFFLSQVRLAKVHSVLRVFWTHVVAGDKKYSRCFGGWRTFPVLGGSVTEPPKSLGPPIVVLVQWTSDNPAGALDHLTSSISAFFTFPKSVSPVTQTLQHIRGTKMRKQLQ
jgi:hypothetical protein